MVPTSSGSSSKDPEVSPKVLIKIALWIPSLSKGQLFDAGLSPLGPALCQFETLVLTEMNHTCSISEHRKAECWSCCDEGDAGRQRHPPQVGTLD